MKASDVKQVCALLNSFLKKFKVAPHFSEDDVRHWFLPIDNVIYSYVVEVFFLEKLMS
jgi:glycylpeptide N-tetradecanoyltransferase